MKGRVYASCARSSKTYGSETRPLLDDVGFERSDMQMIRWMCGVSIKNRKTSEELRKLVGVEPITTIIRSGRNVSLSEVNRFHICLKSTNIEELFAITRSPTHPSIWWRGPTMLAADA